MERTALEENGGSYTRTIVQGETLDIEDESLGRILLQSVRLIVHGLTIIQPITFIPFLVGPNISHISNAVQVKT
jgi:hypothetical protein